MTTEKLKDDFNNQKIEQWEKHFQRADERELYSIQRIDLLTISISGACIYIVFQILQFLLSSEATTVCANKLLLRVSAIFSVSAIVVNFISQITGYHANENEKKYSRLKVKELQNEEIKKELLSHYDVTSIKLSDWTLFLNRASTLFMIIGIIILVYFNLTTF